MSTLSSVSTAVLFGLALAVPASAGAGQAVTPPAQAPTPMPMPASPVPILNSGQAPRAVTPRPGHDSDNDRTAPQAFSVVLVLGDAQTATMQDNVPAAARKALADMKDFLPYKGYRLLDAQWTLCCGSYPITSRLRGAEEQEYELQLSTATSNGRVNVRFFLSESGEAADTDSTRDVRVRIAQLERELASARRRKNAGSLGGAKAEAEMQQEAQKLAAQIDALRLQESKDGPQRVTRRNRGIIDASFRMDVGETVVVGTSRIKGDKALIALLTAVPPKAGATR